MTPAASTEEVRAAYRSLARRLHPDRLAGASEAERRLAERRMREINAAWQALRDPGRRRRYDSDLVGARPAAARADRTAAPRGDGDGRGEDLVPVAPEVGGLPGLVLRHLPGTLVVGVLVVIFVVTAYAATEREPAPVAPAPPGAGACIDVISTSSVREVPCSGPHELEVVRRARDAAGCPEGTSARRFDADRWWTCVRPG